MGYIIEEMAAKKMKSKVMKAKEVFESQVESVMEKKMDVANEFESGLDPAEEKTLDKMLMAIVWFILGWLGLSLLLVFRGYVCADLMRGAFFCAGLIN